MPFFHLCLTCHCLHCTLLVTLVPPILLLLVHYASLTPFFSSAFIFKRFALGVLNLAFDDVERDELIRLPTRHRQYWKLFPEFLHVFLAAINVHFQSLNYMEIGAQIWAVDVSCLIILKALKFLHDTGSQFQIIKNKSLLFIRTSHKRECSPTPFDCFTFTQ